LSLPEPAIRLAQDPGFSPPGQFIQQRFSGLTAKLGAQRTDACPDGIPLFVTLFGSPDAPSMNPAALSWMSPIADGNESPTDAKGEVLISPAPLGLGWPGDYLRPP